MHIYIYITAEHIKCHISFLLQCIYDIVFLYSKIYSQLIVSYKISRSFLHVQKGCRLTLGAPVNVLMSHAPQNVDLPPRVQWFNPVEAR